MVTEIQETIDELDALMEMGEDDENYSQACLEACLLDLIEYVYDSLEESEIEVGGETIEEDMQILSEAIESGEVEDEDGLNEIIGRIAHAVGRVVGAPGRWWKKTKDKARAAYHAGKSGESGTAGRLKRLQTKDAEKKASGEKKAGEKAALKSYQTQRKAPPAASAPAKEPEKKKEPEKPAPAKPAEKPAQTAAPDKAAADRMRKAAKRKAKKERKKAKKAAGKQGQQAQAAPPPKGSNGEKPRARTI